MKKVFIVIVVMSFCLTMAGIAGAAEAVKPGATMQQVPGTTQPVPIFMCPAGWQKDTSSSNPYICKPKPATFSCPQGYIYVDHIKCSMEPISGTLSQGCQGCWIGCVKKVEPPK